MTKPRLIERPWVLRTISTVVLLAGWEIAGRQVDPVLFSPPTAVAKGFWELTVTGELPLQLGKSLQPFLVGFILAAFFGTLIGLVMGRYRMADHLFQHVLNALYTTPNVALIPIIILWFGLGFAAKTFIIFLVSFFPIIYNTADGVRAMSRAYVDVARAYGAGEHQIFSDVTVPAVLPFIMTGVRLGLGRALTGMVVAEMFTALTGVGAMIVTYSNKLDTAKALAGVVVLALLGTALLEVGRALERKFAPWKDTERAF